MEGCKYFFFVCFYLQFWDGWSSQMFQSNHEDIFKNDNMVVWFEPHVSLQDNPYVQNTKYNETSLTPLLVKIATRFSAIMVHLTEDELSDWQYITANAVAKLNVLNNISSNVSRPTLRLWILFHYIKVPEDDSPENSDHLALLTKMAKDANQIFPGSVYAITIHVTNQWQSDGKFILAKHKTILTIMSRERANLQEHERFLIGIMYDVDICVFTGTVRYQLLKFVKDRAEMALFYALSSNRPLALLETNEEAVQRFQEQTKQCKQALESVPSRKTLTHFGVLSGFSDTTPNGDVRYSRLVKFWKSMAIYGQETNTVIILDRAFDTPYLVHVSQATNGWWRLIEDRTYDNPSQYVFEDKEQLAKQIESAPNFNENINQTWVDTNTEFHLSHVGVWAFPFIYDRNLSYSPFTYELLLRKISENFQKLMIGPISLGQDYLISTNLSKTLTLAAEMNTEINNKFEVILVFDVPEDYHDVKWDNFDIMKQNADESNLIYEETTKLMLFNYANVFDDSYHISINNIQNYIESNYTEFSYNYGMILSLDNWCLQETNLTFPLVNNSDSMKMLAIAADIIWLRLVNGVEAYLRKFTIVLENCRNRISTDLVDSQIHGVDVMFILNWNDVYYEDTEIYKLAHFATFWEGINDWAFRKNATVILGQAFESGDLYNQTKHRNGWWIPTKNENGELSFEDKKSAISRLLKEERVRKQQAQSTVAALGTMSIVWISVGVIILLISNVTIVVYVWRKYKLYQYISKGDVHKFFYGVQSETKASEDFGNTLESNVENCSHQKLPYEKTKYEIKKSDFQIDVDENAHLGDGEFGIVQKGKVFKLSGVVIPIAAKAAKHPPKKESLLGLLSEIKTLSYIGKHQNIVSLVGAYTAELHKGIVYVFLEYCHLGSLHNHLCRLKQEVCIENQSMDVLNSTTTCSNIDIKSVPEAKQTLDLEILADFSRWMHDIVSGMMFLSSKYVVHGDLAARNILLTIDKRAKIADFGLSRRMYNYKCYVKAGEELLPWRWMAPESLRHLKFTEKSDIWSFGVLLWEMYSLGETPYPGVFWDAYFANRLDEGLKLCEPSYNDEYIYSIMLKCWEVNPIRRPAFIDVQALLNFHKNQS